MYIDKGKNKFTPIKIVIESQEEAEHLIYQLCACKCPADPMGIEANLRTLIIEELNNQSVNFTGYAERGEKISKEFEKKNHWLDI